MTAKGLAGSCGVSPGLQSGGASFQTRGNALPCNDRTFSPCESQHGQSPSLIRPNSLVQSLGVAPDFSPGERVFKPA
jgi:hypothetical protein